MKRSAYLMSKVIIVAALAAGAVGVANADMGRFDSGYAYFNKYPFDKTPSAWRKDHPSGLSEQQLQADSGSSVSSAWKIDNPALDKAPSDFRLTHPNDPSEHELQALSSDGPAWHTQATPTLVVAQGADRERLAGPLARLAARLARIFSPAKQDAQAR